MRTFVRSADIFHACMASFLLGALVVVHGWNRAMPFFLLTAVVIVGIASLRISVRTVMVACGILATFLFSVIYCHARLTLPYSNTSSYVSGLSLTERLALSRGFALLSYRNAALLGAFIGGSTRRLPPDMRGGMANSGTSYLVGMYGYKLHLLVETIAAVCAFVVPKMVGKIAGLAMAACFVITAGAPISAVRAGIMIIFVSLAELAGRRADRIAALTLSAFVMVAWDPAVCGSVGFLLSFLSLLGIYTLAPALKECAIIYATRIRSAMVPVVADSRIGRMVGAIFGFHATASAAVNLAILPVIARLDGSFPLISFASNVFAALPFGVMLGLGAGLAAAGVTIPSVAILFIFPLNVILGYETMVIRVTAAVPFDISGIAFPPPVMAIYYAGLMVFAWRFRRIKRRA